LVPAAGDDRGDDDLTGDEPSACMAIQLSDAAYSADPQRGRAFDRT